MFGKILGAALAATTFGMAQTAVATADTFVPLPGGTITRDLADGTTVTVSLEQESAKISGSMGGTPVHRNVWVTARASVDLTGPSASTATLKISPGYVVGCQVDISGLSENSNATGNANPSTQGPWTVTPSQAFGTGVTLGPGQAVARLMLDLERPDDYGQESHKRYNKVPGPHTSVTWIDETFSVDGCGGYAQARAFVSAEVDSSNFIGNVLLWGQPFSIG